MIPFYDSSKSGVWNMFSPVLAHLVLNGYLVRMEDLSYLASKQILLPITIARAGRTRAVFGDVDQ